MKALPLFLSFCCLGNILLVPSYGQGPEHQRADSIENYFPLEAFRDSSANKGFEAFVVSWYSKHLHAMHEPILYNAMSENEVYRFTWLRTFHNPVVIRIEKHNDGYTLFWKLCDGAGGYDPGKLTIDRQKPIDKQTWDDFLQRITAIDFWNLPTRERSSGFDGSRWILEAKTMDKYHIVDKWTPKQGSGYYNACDFLIALTDIDIKPRDKY